MDLSSLEGPQMVNPRFIVQPDVPARYHRSRTPTHVLFSKPLPPRPASADPASPQQRYHTRSGWPSEELIDNNPRHAPVRTVRGLSGQIYPDCDPRNEPHLSLHTPQQYQSTSQIRRPRSSIPTNLVWLEDEKLWVVADSDIPPNDRYHEREPLHLTSPVSPLSGYHPASFHRTEYDHYRSARETLPNQLPGCSGHGFGPPHVAQSRDDRVSRWISVVERTQQDRRS
ncbi:uncharacterized protein N7506_005936 [Penicillium brevicompactum]|uniref:uncharacterized protein n=1 Tax=Penicillium brevicompactum TaxID=5074 RepID=UPI00254249FE|nr:uncharacterized protein N7506_005936 [Penicillium brevicompactum]KAJ5332153.1 hypothetical protein N7506_005936 [Penicillium brevicompactum]